jgi:hypothetical protein
MGSVVRLPGRACRKNGVGAHSKDILRVEALLTHSHICALCMIAQIGLRRCCWKTSAESRGEGTPNLQGKFAAVARALLEALGVGAVLLPTDGLAATQATPFQA